MDRLSFYIVDSTYCDYLREQDPCVPYTMDRKSKRPFVGILLEVQGVKYYAPLSSPKPKHLQMKNQIDFIKIMNGRFGVINLNNMIPIHDSSVTKIDPNEGLKQNKDVNYNNLLSNQLTWCNTNKEEILKKAQNLYCKVVGGKANQSLLSRCCDFKLDEQRLLEYIKLHNL